MQVSQLPEEKNISEPAAPLASVLMLAYNHGRFIAQALDGVFSQKTDFSFQVIVCDDCSQDNTREIVDSYAEKHPNLIRSYQPANSRGANNFIDGLKFVNTKYLAQCEGDDYWTDPHKLQKQIDFLEENPAFNVCAHRVKIVYEEGVPHTAGSYVYKDISSGPIRTRMGVFTADEAMDNYYFHTSSFVFRWLFPDGLPGWFAKRMCWDHFLFLLHAKDSWIKYFDEPMSCWRHHARGWTYLQNIDKNLFFSLQEDVWNAVYAEMDKFFNYRFTKSIQKRNRLSVSNVLEYCLKYNEIDRLRSVVNANSAMIRAGLDTSKVFRAAWDVVYPSDRILHLPWTARKSALPAAGEKQIGGYRGLPFELIHETPGNVWDSWTKDREVACFATVNQAILRWLWESRVETVWLPNFYEPMVDYLRREAQIVPVFYECGRGLRPDPAIVNDIGAGHAIITCAWFGAPTPLGFQRALHARKDVYWLEDRRHALDIWGESLAPVVAYSAPDVLGMPDGGILAGKNCAGMDADLPVDPDQVLLPEIRYRLIPYEREYATMQDRLGQATAMSRAYFPCAKGSRFTQTILKSIKIAPLKEKILANFRILMDAFQSICFWQELGDFTPYAFPAIFPNSLFPYITVDIAQSILAKSDILCFRKWHPLQTQLLNRYNHSGAQRLSETLLLIPCDWRYDEEDMKRIVETCQVEFRKFAENMRH